MAELLAALMEALKAVLLGSRVESGMVQWRVGYLVTWWALRRVERKAELKGKQSVGEWDGLME